MDTKRSRFSSVFLSRVNLVLSVSEGFGPSVFWGGWTAVGLDWPGLDLGWLRICGISSQQKEHYCMLSCVYGPEGFVAMLVDTRDAFPEERENKRREEKPTRAF